jgi:REP element-mobilizing transposase RayT
MPRAARIRSKTDIYHVMIRGINQQIIFEDDEDNLKFLEILKEYKTISGYSMLAYCLMGNHIHLLTKEEKEPLSQIFKRIGGKYVYWYNGKYKRTGHLFQDRFKSEPVEDEKYLLTVLRYIHQNPMKAGITDVLKYPWSSYESYINKNINEIVDIETIFSFIDRDSYIVFHQPINQDGCLDISETKVRLTDEQALKVIKEISHCNTVSEIQSMDISKRNMMIKKLRGKGLSIRQISRLTGISKGIVEKT